MSNTSVRVVNSIVNIPQSQLRDDVISLAIANGFTALDVERLEKQQQYRKMYSQRPNVVEKRKQYTQKRYLKMKALRSLLTANL